MRKKKGLKQRIERCCAALQKQGFRLELVPNRELIELGYDEDEVSRGGSWFIVKDKENKVPIFWNNFQSLIAMEQFVHSQLPTEK
jgi:hypothetical protein